MRPAEGDSVGEVGMGYNALNTIALCFEPRGYVREVVVALEGDFGQRGGKGRALAEEEGSAVAEGPMLDGVEGATRGYIAPKFGVCSRGVG